MPADGVCSPLWLMLAGLALIALQLLAFDRLVERHVHDARAQAARYVTVTLQQPASAQPAQASGERMLVAGN